MLRRSIKGVVLWRRLLIRCELLLLGLLEAPLVRRGGGHGNESSGSCIWRVSVGLLGLLRLLLMLRLLLGLLRLLLMLLLRLLLLMLLPKLLLLMLLPKLLLLLLLLLLLMLLLLKRLLKLLLLKRLLMRLKLWLLQLLLMGDLRWEICWRCSDGGRGPRPARLLPLLLLIILHHCGGLAH